MSDAAKVQAPFVHHYELPEAPSPMPAGAFGEAVTERGEHVGWLTKEDVIFATVEHTDPLIVTIPSGTVISPGDRVAVVRISGIGS